MKHLILAGMISAFAVTGLFAQKNTAEAARNTTIRQRQLSQQKRIGAGVNSGQLTAREAARLERKEARLNREIRRDRRDGGGLTARERTRINRRQNRLSRDIHREKHDNQVQPPPAPPAR